MEDVKIKELAALLTGLKYYEWSRLRVAVEKMYSEASNRLELPDTDAVQRNIALELKGFFND